jgi:hypothetical protein
MKIFISWSGAFSHGVAIALQDWLPLIFNPIEVFVSSESIRKGKQWRQAIAKELQASNFGIACLTRDNLGAEWLQFETGALSKLSESSVSTLLLGGLKPADIGENPLSLFQHTIFDKKDFFMLVKAINEAHDKPNRTESSLTKLFETFWDELDKRVIAASKLETVTTKARSVEDMVRETLETVNQMARNMAPSFGSAERFEDFAAYSDVPLTPNTKMFLPVDLFNRFELMGIHTVGQFVENFHTVLQSKMFADEEKKALALTFGQYLTSYGSDALPQLTATTLCGVDGLRLPQWG